MKQELHETYGPSYFNKPFRSKCLVSGKGTQPYYVPVKVEITCTSSKCGKSCHYKRSKVQELRATDERILMFLDIPTTRLPRIIREVFKISCQTFSYRILEVQNIERIFISQLVGKDKDKWGMARVAYAIGIGVEINTMYEIHGYTTVDPSNQLVTHVITHAKKLQSDIDTFVLKDSVIRRLKRFCTRSTAASEMFVELRNLYKTYAHNITKIYGENRFLLHMSVDLAFHSVLEFIFDNEHIHKGWIDAMIIGDPRCGKGYVAERLAKYFGVGEVVGADNATYAGLVGGLQQIQKHWMLTWGKIPLNDRGLLIIDEASEIKHEDWSRLSRIRSEGIAEITKIQSQMTNARTRLLFIANPPNRTVSTYSYGIQAVVDIVRTPEDIARFDYVCVVSHDEVPIHVINEPKQLLPSLYSRQAERELIMWAWSRKVDDIIFDPSAVAQVYKIAIKLSQMFDYSIPLVQGENIRVKLAKLAICFAVRFFSTTDNYQKVYVKKEHVDCAALFLTLLYKTESSGYYIYSRLFHSSTLESAGENLQTVERYFKTFRHPHEIYTCLMMANTITVNDLTEFLGKSKELAIDMVSRLLKHGCLIKKRSGYVKAPFFTAWLKKQIEERVK